MCFFLSFLHCLFVGYFVCLCLLIFLSSLVLLFVCFSLSFVFLFVCCFWSIHAYLPLVAGRPQRKKSHKPRNPLNFRGFWGVWYFLIAQKYLWEREEQISKIQEKLKFQSQPSPSDVAMWVVYFNLCVFSLFVSFSFFWLFVSLFLCFFLSFFLIHLKFLNHVYQCSFIAEKIFNISYFFSCIYLDQFPNYILHGSINN